MRHPLLVAIAALPIVTLIAYKSLQDFRPMRTGFLLTTEVERNVALMTVPIPAELWADLEGWQVSRLVGSSAREIFFRIVDARTDGSKNRWRLGVIADSVS